VGVISSSETVDGTLVIWAQMDGVPVLPRDYGIPASIPVLTTLSGEREATAPVIGIVPGGESESSGVAVGFSGDLQCRDVVGFRYAPTSERAGFKDHVLQLGSEIPVEFLLGQVRDECAQSFVVGFAFRQPGE